VHSDPAMLSRRGFCTLAAGCAVTACAADGGLVQIGPIGGGSGDDTKLPDADPGSPDANRTVPPDAMVSPDASTNPACASGVTDVGLPSAFALNTPKLFSTKGFFVVRDSGGLYALSALCTHEFATMGVSSGHFLCPRHGAEFTFNGAIIGGPVNRPLVHYPMCVMSSGHVGVDTSTTTTASDRLNA